MRGAEYPIITILGAGLSGLSLAYHYSGNSRIFEKSDKVGGTASTENEDGFHFDHGPHVSFTKDPYIAKLITRKVPVENRIAKPMNNYKRSEFSHPALYHLDEVSRSERYKILIDLIEAYKSHDVNYDPKNFYDWCIRNQGKYFAEKYTIPYNNKFWQTDPKHLTTEWIGNRIPVPSIKEAIGSSLGLNKKSGYYYQSFRYPRTGGFGAFSDFWKTRNEKIQLQTNKEVIRINPSENTIEFRDHTISPYEVLISTIPIPEMSHIISDLPENIKNMISRLKFTSLHYVNLALSGKWKRDFTWLYVYDRDIPISRVVPFNVMSDLMSPNDTTSLQIEIPYTGTFDKDLTDKSISALRAKGYLKGHRILKIWHHDLKYGYVIYDQEREQYLKDIIRAFRNMGIYSLGRYGTWAYLWSHQAIEQGIALATELQNEFIVSKNRKREN